MAQHGADGDALADQIQQLELVAHATPQEAQEELEEVKPLTEAEERAAQQGWAELPPEVLEKVFEKLQAAVWREARPNRLRDLSPQEGGLDFCKAVAVVREVCTGWQAVHDAAVKRLAFARQTNDVAVGMLVRRFPAVTSVQFMKLDVYGIGSQDVTDEAVSAVSGQLRALTELDLTCCVNVTDAGLLAVSGLPALTSLNLFGCERITDVGMTAVSSLPALNTLSLFHCSKVTDLAMTAVSQLPALTTLNINFCEKITDVGVLSVSGMPTLQSLHLTLQKVTDEGVRCLSNMPALKELYLYRCRSITDVALRHLSGLKTLVVLKLSYTETSDAAEEELRRQIPGLVIVHERSYDEGTEEDDLDSWPDSESYLENGFGDWDDDDAWY